MSVAAELTCRNCGHNYSATPAAKYCPECGQDTDPTPPTFREFVNHFLGNYIAVKGGFPQTLWRLISKPGALTVDYWEGRKRRYTLPLRLYLTISVIAFLIFGVLTHQSVEQAIADVKPEEFTQGNFISFGDKAKATIKDGEVKCDGLPEFVCDRLTKRFGRKEALREVVSTLPERMVRYWAYAMFALVPLYAGLLKLAYLGRKRTFGEHMVFALHLHTFWILAILLSLSHEWAAAIVTFAVPAYALLAMRRVYRGRWLPLILRAIAISFAYFVCATIAVGIVAMIALVL